MSSQHVNAAVDEDAALLQFPKEFENAETLLISEVSSNQDCRNIIMIYDV